MKKIPKIKGWRWKLLFFGLLAVAVLLFWIFELNCVFRELLNLPCLGCGVTRAYKSLLRGDVAGAFQWHFMFWSAPILFWAVLFDGKITGKKPIDICIYVVLAIGYLARWILWFV